MRARRQRRRPSGRLLSPKDIAPRCRRASHRKAFVVSLTATKRWPHRADEKLQPPTRGRVRDEGASRALGSFQAGIVKANKYRRFSASNPAEGVGDS